MSFGVDVNYKVKKLEARIRAAEEEARDWQMKFDLMSQHYQDKVSALELEITRLRETGIRLPKGRVPKPKPTKPPQPRGRKKAVK